jgi:hypothetical protein
MGWEYKPTEPTEKTKRDRHEVLTQIKSYGDNIKKILLKEVGEIRAYTPRGLVGFDSRESTPRGLVGFDSRESTPTIDVGILENDSDTIDDIDNIRDYTRLFEGFDVPTKKKRRRKRNKSNNFSF